MTCREKSKRRREEEGVRRGRELLLRWGTNWRKTINFSAPIGVLIIGAESPIVAQNIGLNLIPFGTLSLPRHPASTFFTLDFNVQFSLGILKKAENDPIRLDYSPI